MAGKAFSAWWTVVRPYYSKAYQEMWVGIGIMSYLYYKLSYGADLLSIKCHHSFPSPLNSIFVQSKQRDLILVVLINRVQA
ncbi:hypothetical protein XELAEV_18041166mg [Xenopus laevis]|uniref:Uncharacterized protein n=1 Tax=Xenopus laevis TaxID=8355 RepID=A0A974C1N3_XENLA|nr:hypothetical protein XELAEV_18041166mg [Xenopus laevis]